MEPTRMIYLFAYLAASILFTAGYALRGLMTARDSESAGRYR